MTLVADLVDVGTDATIAQHIQTIVDRAYVMERMEGRTKYLVPSTLGVGLVHGYNKIGFDKSLSKPQLRREVNPLSHYLARPLTKRSRQNAGWYRSAKETRHNMTCLKRA